MSLFRICVLAVAAFCGALLLAAGPSSANVRSDCLEAGKEEDIDADRRIEACTAFLATNPVSPTERALAHGSRGLAYSTKRLYAQGIADYDQALLLDPFLPSVWNNRAWAYFRMGEIAQALKDVERSIQLGASSASLDTRAHIFQALGQFERALKDYNLAMSVGDKDLIKLYQCGLAEANLYQGPQDGIDNPELRAAMATCAQNVNCDPLPANEYCRDKITSLPPGFRLAGIGRHTPPRQRPISSIRREARP